MTVSHALSEDPGTADWEQRSFPTIALQFTPNGSGEQESFWPSFL